jgi:drug/metabolite transporter (DMT)-like permease
LLDQFMQPIPPMTPGVTILVLLAAVLHAAWNAALRGGRDRFWAGTSMSFFSAAGCLLCLPFMPLPELASWPFIILSAAIHVLYSLLLVRMYRHGDFGVTYPVARGSSPMLIALGGAVLSSEFINPQHILGIVMVSAGIFTIGFGSQSLHRESVPPALATGVTIAGYSLMDGIGARHATHALSYTVWMMMLQGMGLTLVFLFLRRNADQGLFTGRSAKDIVQAVGAGIISVTGYGIVIWAMKKNPMGMVSALRETSVLFAAILGRLFLGEAFTARKIIAALLIGVGAICLK